MVADPSLPAKQDMHHQVVFCFVYALLHALCDLLPVKIEIFCISSFEPLEHSVNSLKVEASNLLETLVIMCETMNPLNSI
jgi:hypothetical protein